MSAGECRLPSGTPGLCMNKEKCPNINILKSRFPKQLTGVPESLQQPVKLEVEEFIKESFDCEDDKVVLIAINVSRCAVHTSCQRTLQQRRRVRRR